MGKGIQYSFHDLCRKEEVMGKSLNGKELGSGMAQRQDDYMKPDF